MKRRYLFVTEDNTIGGPRLLGHPEEELGDGVIHPLLAVVPLHGPVTLEYY